MTRKRFQKLARAAMTRCHEVNLAAGERLTYIPGRVTNGNGVRRASGMSYAESWARISSVLPERVGK